jgi:hypothetical protein
MKFYKFMYDLVDGLRRKPYTPETYDTMDGVDMYMCYISVSPHYFLVLRGISRECTSIRLHYLATIERDIMTSDGLAEFGTDFMVEETEELFCFQIGRFQGSMEDLVWLIVDWVRCYCPDK